MKAPNLRVIVANERGSGFVFPQDEVLQPLASAGGALEGVAVPLGEFMKLTKIPIAI